MVSGGPGPGEKVVIQDVMGGWLPVTIRALPVPRGAPWKEGVRVAGGTPHPGPGLSRRTHRVVPAGWLSQEALGHGGKEGLWELGFSDRRPGRGPRTPWLDRPLQAFPRQTLFSAPQPTRPPSPPLFPRAPSRSRPGAGGGRNLHEHVTVETASACAARGGAPRALGPGPWQDPPPCGAAAPRCFNARK